MEDRHVHISNGVTKLGIHIPSVNLPPVVTCRPGAPCVAKCYARKGRFCFNRNKSLLDYNLDIWEQDAATFEDDVFRAASFAKFFRWHSSGDIPDENYFAMMVRIANKIPATKFLCFTKKYELVNSWLDEHEHIPDNLIIVLSAWGDFVPENPYNLPVAYVQLRNADCHIPATAIPCSGFCGDCVFTGCSCWDLKAGQSVRFNEH